MKLIFGILLTFFIGQTTCAQDFTIRGFIYNKADGEPMPFEKIRLLNADSTNLSGAITDVNGFFSLSKLNKGEYIIKVESG